jgi:EamA domain-containing membrane protein RarD
VARARAVVATVHVVVVLLSFLYGSRAVQEVAKIDPVLRIGQTRAAAVVHFVIIGARLGIFVYVVEHKAILR